MTKKPSTTIKQITAGQKLPLYFQIDGTETSAEVTVAAVKRRPNMLPMLVFEWTNSKGLPAKASMTWEAYESNIGERVELGAGEVLERSDFVA